MITNGFPFIKKPFLFSINIKALLMNEYPLVEFGFPSIRNLFLFQINMKALLMNGYSLVEFGFLLAANTNSSLSYDQSHQEAFIEVWQSRNIPLREKH